MDLTTYKRLLDYNRNRNLIIPESKVLLMISGGRDSVFLLNFFDYLRDVINVNFGIFHLNHMIRGKESERDKKFVEDLAKDFNAPIFEFDEDIIKIAKKKRKNLEECARDVRYNIASGIADREHYSAIITAHTKDDYIETVIFHLIRGDSIYGLAGINERTGRFIRPLLTITREEITRYLIDNNIKWMDDSTNDNIEYTRNFIRHRIVGALKEIGGNNVIEKIYKTGLIMNDYIRGSGEFANEIFKRIIIIKNNKLHLDLTSYFRYNCEGKRLLLIAMINYLGLKVDRKIINFIYDFLEGDSLTKKYNNNLFLYKDEKEAVIFKMYKKFNYKLNINERLSDESFTIECGIGKMADFKLNDSLFFFEREKMRFPITVRNKKNGDKMVPSGFRSKKTVKDIFNDRKIPIWERDNFPILESGDEIIGIPGIRRSNLMNVKNRDGENIYILFRRVNED